jgi:hypothetical protein
MADEPESPVLRILREMHAELASEPDLETLCAALATKAELAELKSDMHSLRAGVPSDLMTMHKELSE